MSVKTVQVKIAACNSCGRSLRSADDEKYDELKARLREDGWYFSSSKDVLCPSCAAVSSKRRNSRGRVERLPHIVAAWQRGVIDDDVAESYFGASSKRWAACRDEYLEHGTVDGEVPLPPDPPD